VFECRLFGGRGSTSVPSIMTTPSSGVSKPAMMRSKVVLPQPEGPRREKNSPFLISKLTSLSALKSPNAFDTRSMLTSLPFN